jgi:hypothetical protein
MPAPAGVALFETPHTLFLFFPPWYPPGITGEKQKYNQSRVFTLSRVLKNRLYRNQASAQLHLMRTLILVKPVASGFTLHQSSTHLEVTYCAHCPQDLFSTGHLTKVLTSVVWFSLLQRKTWLVEVGYLDPWPVVLKKIKELVLTYNRSSPKNQRTGQIKESTVNHQFSAGSFIKTC